MPGERLRKPLDRLIAVMAECQHGVVSIEQLLSLGLGPKAIQHRIARGLLHPVHRGVYAVGHSVLTTKGNWTAAVLAAGAGAVLSYRAAAELHRIVDLPRAGIIDVTVGRRPGKRPGLRIHEARVADEDRTVLDSIPVTAVARTLIDVAATEPRSLEPAIGRAERRGLLDLGALDDAIHRARGRRGVGRVRTLREAFSPTAEFTRSELERRFLGLCRAHGLLRPKTNLWISLPEDGFEVDFCWPEQRLIIETDSAEWHDQTLARKRDRHRDELLTAAGWLVIRLRWHDVGDLAARTADRLVGLLASRTRG